MAHRASQTYLAPWPRWLQMGAEPGHVVWHADGLKLRAVEELPPAVLARVQNQFPDQLVVPAG